MKRSVAPPPPHRCRGVTCPDVVNTGEALVCALTGVCVGDVVMASYDFVSTSSLCRERKKRRDDGPEDGPDDFGEDLAETSFENANGDGDARPSTSTTSWASKLVSDSKLCANRKRGFANAADVSDPRRDGNDRRASSSVADLDNTKTEKLYGECYRVVEKLFGKCEGVSDEWKDAVTLRCRDCHVLCVSALGNNAASKLKSDYGCLAALYLMREGLVIKGTRVCEVEEKVAANIPSLNAMTKFGFQKSKYTRAYRTLMDAIDKAQYAVPLHELKI